MGTSSSPVKSTLYQQLSFMDPNVQCSPVKKQRKGKLAGPLFRCSNYASKHAVNMAQLIPWDMTPSGWYMPYS